MADQGLPPVPRHLSKIRELSGKLQTYCYLCKALTGSDDGFDFYRIEIYQWSTYVCMYISGCMSVMGVLYEGTPYSYLFGVEST